MYLVRQCLRRGKYARREDNVNLHQLDTEREIGRSPAQQESSIDLLPLLLVYPICESICKHLDVQTLLALQMTTKQISANMTLEKKKRWGNVNKRLSRFVFDPEGLRSQMGRCDAVISGSFVLQHIDDTFWEDSNLDIFVQDGDGADELVRHLVDNEGYTYVDQLDQETKRDSGRSWFTSTEIYRRSPTSGSTKTTEVQIISSHEYASSTAAVLYGCITTATTNIMTWNTIYVVYPYFTFLARQMYMTSHESSVYEPYLDKYVERGWARFETLPAGKTHKSIRMKEDSRRIGDSQTWIIALDTNGVEPSATPDYVFENIHFNLVQKDTFYGIHIRRFRSWVLRYTYYSSLSCCDFWKFVQDRLDILTLIELQKLDATVLPPEYKGPIPPITDLGLVAGIFTRPPNWTYVDDQLPKWRAEWEAWEPGEKLRLVGGNR